MSDIQAAQHDDTGVYQSVKTSCFFSAVVVVNHQTAPRPHWRHAQTQSPSLPPSTDHPHRSTASQARFTAVGGGSSPLPTSKAVRGSAVSIAGRVHGRSRLDAQRLSCSLKSLGDLFLATLLLRPSRSPPTGERSTVITMSVCLSTSISPEIHVRPLTHF